MTETITALFRDSAHAGRAVAELKERGFSKEISILAYNRKYENPALHIVKDNVAGGTAVGGSIGAVTGALAGILSGISAVVVPGVGAIVGGPLVTLLGVTGGAIGTLAGGIVGGLVDIGVNESTARLYGDRIRKGEVLVGVTVDGRSTSIARSILLTHDATDLTTSRS